MPTEAPVLFRGHIERSAHFSDKKLCYYSPNVRNVTFLSYQSEIPKFGYDKSFIDSDIGNPSLTITCSGRSSITKFPPEATSR